MISLTEVDGVRTLVTPHAGPMRAGLVFRVGFADEPLPRRGITHLVEHLALHRHGEIDHQANAATAVTTTHFFTSGTPAEVVGYLTAVCESLTNLPMERLPVEKSVLRTEEAGRGVPSLPIWRYGAVGYGTVGFPEWGLDALGPDDLRHWVGTRFTRENAVLWIAGEVPPGLRLALPSGPVNPMPPLTSALPTTPAFYAEATTTLAFSGIVGRGPRAALFADLLDRVLFQALRREDGNSYSPHAAYLPRDAQFAQIMAVADALPEKQAAVLGGFVDVLAAMRVGRIDETDLAAVRTKTLSRLDRPDAVADSLPSAAVDLLIGHRGPSVAQLRDAYAAVTVDDLRAVAMEMISTGLLQVPKGLGAEWAGFTPAPVWSSKVVHGNAHASLEHEGQQLVLGGEGVSLVTNSGAMTVTFRDCVAMRCWPDGARQLVGADGVSVAVEPTLFDMPPTVIGWLDAQVHPRLRITRPARAHVPRPSAKVPPAPVGVPVPPPPPKRAASRKAGLIFLSVLTGFFTLLAVVGTLAFVNDGNHVRLLPGMIFEWVLAAAWGLSLVLVLRKGRRAKAVS